VEKFKQDIIDRINADPILDVEYFDVVDARTLESVGAWEDAGGMRGCIAVRAGKVRLIDNMEIL